MKENISSAVSFPEGPKLVQDARLYMAVARHSVAEWRAEEESQLSNSGTDPKVVDFEGVKIRQRLKQLSDFEGKCKRLEEVVVRLEQNPREGRKFLDEGKKRYEEL